MKKIPISRWLTLVVLFAFLFNACSTSVQSPTATEVSPTQTDTPTDTSTPRPTDTATPTATATSEATSTPAPTQSPVDFTARYTSSANWIEVFGEGVTGPNKTIIRGATYATVEEDVTGHHLGWIVAPIIFNPLGTKSSTLDIIAKISTTQFPYCTGSDLNSGKSCGIPKSAIIDGSYAKWVKQNFAPNGNILIGLAPNIAASKQFLKDWEQSKELAFVTGDSAGGTNQWTDYLVQEFLQNHQDTTDKLIKFSSTLDPSLLDGAVAEVVLGY